MRNLMFVLLLVALIGTTEVSAQVVRLTYDSAGNFGALIDPQTASPRLSELFYGIANETEAAKITVKEIGFEIYGQTNPYITQQKIEFKGWPVNMSLQKVKGTFFRFGVFIKDQLGAVYFANEYAFEARVNNLPIPMVDDGIGITWQFYWADVPPIAITDTPTPIIQIATPTVTSTSIATPTPKPSANPLGLIAVGLSGMGDVKDLNGCGFPTTGGPYFGWDIARDIIIVNNGKGGLILDGFGGVHPIGNAEINNKVYFGWDIAKEIKIVNNTILILDGYGAVHVANGPNPSSFINDEFYFGWDIARSFDVLLIE